MALCLVLSDGGLKLEPREQLQQLGENAGYSFHGGGLLWRLFVLARTMTTYQSARRLLSQVLIWTSLGSHVTRMWFFNGDQDSMAGKIRPWSDIGRQGAY
jgi:hypothetical protein